MKTRGKLCALCLFLISMIAGCKKEDSSVIVVDNGTWKVSYFSRAGDDQTTHFSGYSFRFEKKGKAIASNTSGTVNGTWSCDSQDGKLDFQINFSPAPLNELNKQWHVIDQTVKTMQLQYPNSGSGGADFLTFQKE